MRLLKIGRDAANDIVLHSDKVSSIHAELTLLDNGDIILEDKFSHNGTFIMNQPIKPGKGVNVRRGDAIRFADVELMWSQVPMPEDNSAYKGLFGIGSHFNNYIQVPGGTVSRYHATVKQAKDGKMYIVDHSKNGTTVDGVKIMPNTPVRIKKKSAIACGGVSVDLSRLPWPSEIWKTLLAAAAGVLLLCGIGFGIWKMLGSNGPKTLDDGEMFARYNHSLVMMIGVYHYNVTIGDMSADNLKRFGIPSKVLLAGNSALDVSSMSSKELVNQIKAINNDSGLYTGTGFFVSDDGKVITNLHLVKPWLFDGNAEKLRSIISKQFAANVEVQNKYYLYTQLSAYLSEVKVEGELDYIALVPQGEVFDADNMIKCRVLSAGENKEKDVALIQTISRSLPTSRCTFVNVKDSMDVTPEALNVGNHIVTMGYPLGMDEKWEVVQKRKNEKGIQAISNGGDIMQEPSEFTFGINAASFKGASGSPVFDNKGMLIGIISSGVPETQGYNYAVKAQYVKELLESPYVN